MKNLLRVLLVAFCLGEAISSARAEEGDENAPTTVSVPSAPELQKPKQLRLVPEPGIFILIATSGFLFIIRRRS